jgi:hypothetical protein
MSPTWKLHWKLFCMFLEMISNARIRFFSRSMSCPTPPIEASCISSSSSSSSSQFISSSRSASSIQQSPSYSVIPIPASEMRKTVTVRNPSKQGFGFTAVSSLAPPPPLPPSKNSGSMYSTIGSQATPQGRCHERAEVGFKLNGLTSDVMYRCASANDPHPNEAEEGDGATVQLTRYHNIS